MIWLPFGIVAGLFGAGCGWSDPTGYFENIPSPIAAILSAAITVLFVWILSRAGEEHDLGRNIAAVIGAVVLSGAMAGLALLGGGSVGDAACMADLGFVGGAAMVFAPLGAGVGLLAGGVLLGVYWIALAPSPEAAAERNETPFGAWISSILFLLVMMNCFAIVTGKHLWNRSRR
ncbi:MAG: hypothetical protein PVI23_06010 [Maricaulaceae bacterium]|jgi:hypothetical protein